MKPIHDHATLFLAPSAPRVAEADGRSRRTADRGTEALRRLRHPFTRASVVPAVAEAEVRPRGDVAVDRRPGWQVVRWVAPAMPVRT